MVESALTGVWIVCGSVLLAVVGLLLVRARVSVAALEGHHEVAGFFIGVLGAIYAVLLAFVVIVVWEKFEEARVVVSQEANAIGDLSRLSHGLPDEAQPAIRAALLGYAETVVKEEWPAMQRGESSPSAWAHVTEIWKVYRDLEPRTFVEQTTYQKSIDRLSDLTDSRRLRLFACEDHIPRVLWILLWGGGAVTVVFTYFFGVRNMRAQVLMTTMLSMLISFVLYLIVALNNPFDGVVRVASNRCRKNCSASAERAYE